MGEVYGGFWWGNLRKRVRLEDPGIGGKIILERIFRKYDWGMGWINLAEDTDRLPELIIAVMKLRVP